MYSLFSFSVENLVKLLNLGGTLCSVFDEVDFPICIVFVIRSGFVINEVTIMLRISILYKEFEACSSKLNWKSQSQTTLSQRETDKKIHPDSSLILGI